MEHYEWAETLDRHAVGLQAGTNLGAPLLAAAPPEERGALGGLLTLAQRVQSTLAGQPRYAPRPAFVAQLKADLLAAPRLASDLAGKPNRRAWLWWAAGAGGVISAAGLGFLAYKAIENGVSGIMSARAARPALSKAQPAP